MRKELVVMYVCIIVYIQGQSPIENYLKKERRNLKKKKKGGKVKENPRKYWKDVLGVSGSRKMDGIWE